MLQVFCQKELLAAYISISMGIFTVMGISSTLTMQLMQTYDFKSEMAYYFFATWGVGYCIGNLFCASLIKYEHFMTPLSFITQLVSLYLIGPSNFFIFESFIDQTTSLYLMAFGLVFLGLSTATLVTLSNMNALTVVQRWGKEEFPKQDITSLIAKMQSWVIVAIGGAEMFGCVFGALVYDKMNFKYQTDAFFLTVLVSFISNRLILRKHRKRL